MDSMSKKTPDSMSKKTPDSMSKNPMDITDSEKDAFQTSPSI